MIGGGLPVGAFGGLAALMAELAPAGPVYQAGTLSGNPLATAAGLAVSEVERRRTTRRWPARVAGFAKELESAIAGSGLLCGRPGGRGPGRAVPGARGGRSPRACRPTTSSARVLAANGVYGRFFHAMLRRGVALAPGPYEVMFPGLAHDEAVLAAVVEAAGQAAAEVASRGLTPATAGVDVRSPCIRAMWGVTAACIRGAPAPSPDDACEESATCVLPVYGSSEVSALLHMAGSPPV